MKTQKHLNPGILNICFILTFSILIAFPSHGHLYNGVGDDGTGDLLKTEQNENLINSTFKGMVVTHALYEYSEGEFCVIDTRGRPDLTPSFVQTARGDFDSPLSFENIPFCSYEDESYVQFVSENSAIGPAAGKTAALPALLLPLAFGCAAGGAGGAAAGGTVSAGGGAGSAAVAAVAVVVAATGVSAAAGGGGAAAAVAIGAAIVCGGVTYFLLSNLL